MALLFHTTASELVELLVGRPRPSLLMTDAYKLSMAQAGFPLRDETFALVLRQGGPFLVPFDLAAVARALLPEPPTAREAAFLAAGGYGLTPAMEQALCGPLLASAVPAGSWVLAGEPLLTLSGPSFLVSWMEPLVIALHYPIQVATALAAGQRHFAVTCAAERGIVEWVAAGMGLSPVSVRIAVAADQYAAAVARQAGAVSDALDGETVRAFEVGLRSATCIEQHRLALRECQRLGISRTSNLLLACELDLVPVGTTGHEHQQRWGSDLDGFRAVRDMRPQPPSYLIDTYDPIRSGIPAAVQAMRETPERRCSIRFDSGDQDEQLRRLLSAEQRLGNICPSYVFEDGYTAERTRRNQALLAEIDPWPRRPAGPGGTCHGSAHRGDAYLDETHRDRPRLPARSFYGYGGFLVSEPSPSPFGRDRVSAVYKLTRSGGQPRMKFSGTPGKASLPGLPVIFRPDPRRSGDGPAGIVGQLGEQPPAGYVALDDDPRWQATWAARLRSNPPPVALSPATHALVTRLAEERDRAVARWAVPRDEQEAR